MFRVAKSEVTAKILISAGSFSRRDRISRVLPLIGLYGLIYVILYIL